MKKGFFNKTYILALAGFFFLVNPHVHIVDFLPDVIGYTLLYFGIAKLALLDGRMESARSKLFYLAIISALRLLLTPAVLNSGYGTDKLLAVFSFSIVEIILLVLFYYDFFEGFSYLAERNEGIDVFDSISNARVLTLVFFIAKMVAPVLPELYSLVDPSIQSDLTNYDYYENLMSTKPYVTVILLLSVLALGIFWYISIVKMLKTAKSQSNFVAGLESKYNERYIIDPSRGRIKNYRYGTYLLIFSTLFLFDFSVDSVNLLPDPLAVVFVIIGVMYLSRIGSFTQTKRLSWLVFAYLVLTEIFMYLVPDTDAIIFAELRIDDMAVGGIIAVGYLFALIIYIRAISRELFELYNLLTLEKAPDFTFSFLLFITGAAIRAFLMVLPHLRLYLYGPHLIIMLVFAIVTGYKLVTMSDRVAVKQATD